jgi:hypothetical protein
MIDRFTPVRNPRRGNGAGQLLQELSMRSVVAWGISALVVSAFVVGTVTAGDAPGLKSGLQVGEMASPFNVQDITGPNKGTSLCYR